MRSVFTTAILASTAIANPWYTSVELGHNSGCVEQAIDRYHTSVKCIWLADANTYAAIRKPLRLPEGYTNASIMYQGASGGAALNEKQQLDPKTRGLGASGMLTIPDGFNGSICAHPGVNGQDATKGWSGQAPAVNDTLLAAGSGGGCLPGGQNSWGGAGGTLTAITFSDEEVEACDLLSVSEPKAKRWLIVGGGGGAAAGSKVDNEFHASPGGHVPVLSQFNALCGTGRFVSIKPGEPGRGRNSSGETDFAAGGSSLQKSRNETDASIMFGKTGLYNPTSINCMATGGGGSGYRGGQGGVPSTNLSGSGGGGSSAISQSDRFIVIRSGHNSYSEKPKIFLSFVRPGPASNFTSTRFEEAPAAGSSPKPRKGVKLPTIDVFGDEDL